MNYGWVRIVDGIEGGPQAGIPCWGVFYFFPMFEKVGLIMALLF
jgi:hypothetical protein